MSSGIGRRRDSGSSRRGSAGANGHPRDHLADADRVAVLVQDLRDGAIGWGGQLHVDLVGRDLDDGVPVLDRVTDLDRPLEDRALGDTLAPGRSDDVEHFSRCLRGGGRCDGGGSSGTVLRRAT